MGFDPLTGLGPPINGTPPNSPFRDGSSLFLNIERKTLDEAKKTQTYEVTSIKVNPEPAVQPRTLTDFSQITSDPEQIWSFQAKALAETMALCAACANRLEQEAQSLKRDVWRQNINALAPQVSQLQQAAENLCNIVADTIDKK